MESQETGESSNQEPQEETFMIRELERFTQLKSDQDESREHLRRTLIIEMQNLMGQVAWLQDISIKIRESLELKAEEKLQIESEEPPKILKIPELILKEIVMISTTKEVHISSVSNKLKVFVSKAMQKESSKLRYNYNSYITQVLEEVNDFGFNQQVEEMRVELQELRKKFRIIDVNVISMHKHHLDIKRPIENANFYISFYVERLLFFNDTPIKYNGKLLFVPMGIGKSLNRDTNKITYIKISPNYMRELSRENVGWETFCLEIIFMNSVTSEILYYSNISYEKKWHENETSALLRKIRCFIYFSLIFNYLQNNLLSSACTMTSTSINLPLTPKIEVTFNTQPQIKTSSSSLKSDHRITKEILGYFDESKMKKRNETSREEVTDNFVNYLRCVKVRMEKGEVGLGEGSGLRAKYVYVGDKRVLI